MAEISLHREDHCQSPPPRPLPLPRLPPNAAANGTRFEAKFSKAIDEARAGAQQLTKEAQANVPAPTRNSSLQERRTGR
jgi:hypothetical protein